MTKNQISEIVINLTNRVNSAVGSPEYKTLKQYLDVMEWLVEEASEIREYNKELEYLNKRIMKENAELEEQASAVFH